MAAAALMPGEAGNPADPQSADSLRLERIYTNFLKAFSTWEDEVNKKCKEIKRVYVINEKLFLEPKNSDGDVKEELVRRLFTNLPYDSPKNNFCVVHGHTFYGVMFNPGNLDQLQTYIKFNGLSRNQQQKKLKEFNSEHDFIALHPTGGIIFIEVSGTGQLKVDTIDGIIEKKQRQLTKGRDLMKIFVRQMMNIKQRKTLAEKLDRFFKLCPLLMETDQKQQQESLEEKLDRFFKLYPLLRETVIKEQQENLAEKLDLFSKLCPLLMETDQKQQQERPEEKLDRFFKLYPLLMETDQKQQQKNLKDKLDRFFKLFPHLMETVIKEQQENLEDKLDRFFEHHPLFCLFPYCNRPTEKHLVLKLDDFTKKNGTRFFFTVDLHRLVSTMKESFAGFDDCTFEEEFRKDVYRISLQCCITSSRSTKQPSRLNPESAKKVTEEIDQIFFSSIQCQIVNSTESFKCIGGPAGTGKTVVAIQKVKTILGDIVRRKAWGEKIFLLTMTKENADSIREEIANSFANYSGNLTDVLHVLHLWDFLTDFHFRPLNSLISEYTNIFIDDFETVIYVLRTNSNFFSDFESKNAKYLPYPMPRDYFSEVHPFKLSEFLTDLRKYWDECRGKSGCYFWIFCDPNQNGFKDHVKWEMTDELPVIFRTCYRIAQLYLSEFLYTYKYKSPIEFGHFRAGSDVEILSPESGQTIDDLLETKLAKLKKQFGDNVALIDDRLSRPNAGVLFEKFQIRGMSVEFFAGREFDAVVYIPRDFDFHEKYVYTQVSRARLKLTIICSQPIHKRMERSIGKSSFHVPLCTTDGEAYQKQKKKNERKLKNTEETPERERKSPR